MALLDSFDKKRIAFVGNSFTFFGKCVRTSTFDGADNGYFYSSISIKHFIILIFTS